MEKQVKRSANWQQDEKDLLSKIVLDKLDIIEDSRIDTNTNKKKKDAWNAIHLLFNQATSHNRTLDQIQNQWRKTKSLAKTNNSAFIKNTKQTGGGPAPKPLSSVEEELVSRLPKHFEIDTNIYDSNSQKNEPSSENVDVSEINKSISADDEIFNTEGDTPIKEIKKTINLKRKRTMKCQCEIEKENVRRIELLDLSIKQKALEIKLKEETHTMQKRKYEMLEQQEKEEHTLRVEKIKLEIEKLKKVDFLISVCCTKMNEM